MATAKMMDKEKIVDGVDHLVNPLDNAINEKCSRIKKVFLELLDADASPKRIYMRSGTSMPRSAIAFLMTLATLRARTRRKARFCSSGSLRML